MSSSLETKHNDISVKPPAPFVPDSDSEEDIPLAQVIQRLKEKEAKKQKEAKPAETPLPKTKKPKLIKDDNKKIDATINKTKTKKTNEDVIITNKTKKTNEDVIITNKTKKTNEDAIINNKTKKSDDITNKTKKTNGVKTNTSTTSTSTTTTTTKASSDDDSDSGEEEYKWWENPTWDDTIKWETLEHSGVFFPPPYQPHGIKMLYEGRPIELEPEAEEVAGFFAALLETDYAQNATFTANFFTDFRALLHKIKSPAAAIITQFEKCDFRPMFHYFEQVKLARKAMTREDRAKVKDEKARLDAEFAFCTLDGRRERVGNYRIEPPGLFRGRGQHPKTGKLKTRVAPEDITINCSPGAKIPLPPPGHQWKDVIHNSTVTWLATWTENINGVPKYVQLSATSSLKGKSDYKKFETARRLKHHIAAIRARNAEELRSKEMAVRQRATALWLIDHLAIRAGNEKGDDEADTVGCCSLRLEHVSLDPEKSQVTFDFLGKDSIRYLNTLQVDPLIIKNLAIFMRPPKGPSDMIFDRLDTSLLNSYLTSLMPGLTAKVFRTFNASITMQKELFNSAQDAPDASIADKLLAYNRANRQVAILCNHQRAVAKSHDQSMSKLNEKIMHLKYHRLLLKRKLHEDSGDEEAQESDIDPDMEKQIIREITELEMEKYRKKMERDGTPVDPKYQPPTPCPAGNKTLSKDALEKKIDAISIRIQAARHQATDREENKTTALGTSKINYIDPRITAAWCKTHQVPIEKMFTKTLRDKFKWAMDVPEEWRF